MAANTYTQQYADGTSEKMHRIKKQGAPNKPDSLRRTKTIIAHVTESEYRKFIEMKQRWFLSASNFASLVISVGINEISESNN
jgi:hypothetical protein